MRKVALSIHAKEHFSIDIMKNLRGLDYIHIDLMDGKFVINKCLNFEVFKLIKEYFDLPIIAHMMVQDPSQYLNEVLEYSDYFLFHFETEEDRIDLIEKIKAHNKKVGIAINPETRISAIKYLLDEIDMVLVLGVHPGWSGQQFISDTINKINELAIYKEKSNFLIDVDGGVNLQNAILMKNADILTSASTILFAENPNSVINQLKNI